MKQIITFFLIAALFYSCKKNLGTMKYKAKFCTTTNKSLHKASNDSIHTLFGDYITSITPYHFSCNVGMFIFQDYYNQSDPRCHMIAYIENRNMEVDFSGNTEVEFSPTLHSTDIWNGLFERKEVDFKFISFGSDNFNHEFEIPIQYLPIIQNNSNWFLQNSTFNYDSIAQKITVKSANLLHYGAIHGNANAMPTNFMLTFGKTDTSYVYMYNGVDMPEDKRFPFWNFPSVVLRSSKFKTQKIVMPGKGETFTMYATLSVDTENLIQIYAGNDNIPYTADDVFVYAPQFWDRVNINLEMK